jgi:hypothetical protein
MPVTSISDEQVCRKLKPNFFTLGTRVVLGRETSPIPNGGNLPRDILAKYSGKSKEVGLLIDFLYLIFQKTVFSFIHVTS